ncbi:MAG: hypothetical protein WAU88_10805 [Candidatus Zixiibacteriota bacterium]
MVSDEQINAKYKILRVITIILLVGGPLAYFEVYRFVSGPGTLPLRPNDLLFYILLGLSLFQGIFIPIFQRISVHKVDPSKLVRGTILDLAQAQVIVTMAFIESIYIYGLAIFFVTGSGARLPYFYAIAIVYSIIYWPSQSRFTELVRKLEAT